ncbi:MAG: hypothetical protein HYZ75_11780 [Elusimicrobia bacterium]|nr:hypothetical protein [Elusimicrobiota bacterium]
MVRAVSILWVHFAALPATAGMAGVCLSGQRWDGDKWVTERCLDEKPDRNLGGTSGLGSLWTSYDWEAAHVPKLTLPIVASKTYSEETEFVRREDPPAVRRAVKELHARRARRLRELTEGMKEFVRRAHGLNDPREQGACIALRSRAAADALQSYGQGDSGWRGFVVPWGLEESADGAVCLPGASMRLDDRLLGAHSRYLREAQALLADLAGEAAQLREDVLRLQVTLAQPIPATKAKKPKRRLNLLARAQALAREAGVGPAGVRAAAVVTALRSSAVLGESKESAAAVDAAAADLRELREELRPGAGGAAQAGASSARVGPGEPWVTLPRIAALAYRDAGAAAAAGDPAKAAGSALAAIQTAPAWSAPRWSYCLAKEAEAAAPGRPSPADLKAAALNYEGFAGVAWFKDDRGGEALKRAAELRALAADLEQPPVSVTRRRTKVTRTYVAVPLGRPSLFWDAAGGSFGGAFRELHALRLTYFHPAFKSVGFGLTAIARYWTPFEATVAGAKERVAVDALLPVEAAWSPLNVRFWRNSTLSPQVFLSFTPLARFHSETLKGSLKAGPVREAGLRVPFGAFAGLRASWLAMKVADAGASGSNPAYRGFDETRFNLALDFFLGAMLSAPKVR